MRALIVIDYTNDFVADDGNLTCGERGQSIEERITEISRQFIESNDYTVFAVDAHEEQDPYHPETSLFPTHNVKGTTGRKLYGQLGQYVDDITYSAERNFEWLDKTRYSAFAGTDLEIKLRERQIQEIHLVGLCTDICILHTAVDAYNKGFTIIIHGDAVESFNPAGHEWALEHFKASMGAVVIEKWSNEKI